MSLQQIIRADKPPSLRIVAISGVKGISELKLIDGLFYCLNRRAAQPNSVKKWERYLNIILLL